MELTMSLALEGKTSGSEAQVRAARSRRYLRLALLYLVFLALAEALTVYADIRLGMIAHITLLVALLANAASTGDETLRRSLLALAIAPLVRITSVSLPLERLTRTESFLVAGIPMLAAASATARALRLSRMDVGLVMKMWPAQLAVFLAGFAFGIIEYLILEPQPLIPELSLASVWVPVLVLTVATGFAEEFAFRGVIQSSLSQTMGRMAIPYLAAVFAVLHLGYRSGLDVLFVFAVGLFFGWVVFKTKSIVGVTLSHSATNVTLFILVPLLLVGSPGGSGPEVGQFPAKIVAATSQQAADGVQADERLAQNLPLSVGLVSL